MVTTITNSATTRTKPFFVNSGYVMQTKLFSVPH